MSLGVESYSCILLATRNGNQQEAERRSGCCCHQGKRVADYASPHDPSELDRSPADDKPRRTSTGEIAEYHIRPECNLHRFV